MELTASKLRADIYRVLDYVLDTGEVVEIDRRGRRLRITADEPPSRLADVVRRPEAITGNPDDLVDIEWSGEWTG